MLRKIFSLILIGFGLQMNFLLAQEKVAQKKINFRETSHEFGKIQEGDIAKYSFVFTNIGKEPVTLKSVRASCGCTTPQWEKDPILPGSKSKIEVNYNSLGRPGEFTKTVTVIYDTTQSPIILTIKGNVIPKEKTTATNDHANDTHDHAAHDHHDTPSSNPPNVTYSDTIGFLAIEKTHENFGILRTTEGKELSFTVQNIGKQTINFTNQVDKKDYVNFTISAQTLKPGEKATVTIELLGQKVDKTATVIRDAVTYYTTEKTNARKTFTIEASYERAYTEAEKAIAPAITFSKKEFNGGDVIQGEVLNYTYTFTNTGKSDLIIESAKPSCGCTASAPEDKIVKPGQNSTIKASFNSTGRVGPQMKTITVLSNDPTNPAVTLILKCNIIENPFRPNAGAPNPQPQE